jgi:hypothetical protein
MKTITVRLPKPIAAALDAESRARNMTKSQVIRERLQTTAEPAANQSAGFQAIADLVGSVAGLPADLSARKKWHLKKSGYGKKHRR